MLGGLALRVPPGTLPRALFGLTLAGSLGLVGLDLSRFAAGPGDQADALPPSVTTAPSTWPAGSPADFRRASEGDQVRPFLPAVRPLAPGEPLPAPTGKSMVFTVGTDGEGAQHVLAAGDIVPGTADAFGAFMAGPGSGIRTVVLDSPGGAVSEAIMLGQTIRALEIDIRVEANGVCASACPLILAGGIERQVAATAWVGVHRAFIRDRGIGDTLEGMRRGQQVAAECMTHLQAMGVSVEAWLPALNTPWTEMYFFTPDQLLELKLATEVI